MSGVFHAQWAAFCRDERLQGQGRLEYPFRLCLPRPATDSQPVCADHHDARSRPRVAAKRDETHQGFLALVSIPKRHSRPIWYTTLLEQVNSTIKRRTDVGGVFPEPASRRCSK